MRTTDSWRKHHSYKEHGSDKYSKLKHNHIAHLNCQFYRRMNNSREPQSEPLGDMCPTYVAVNSASMFISIFNLFLNIDVLPACFSVPHVYT